MLKLSKQASQICSNAVMVTGSARSGTTIMGKLIHSFRQVEYAYEPPMLFTLFSLIEKLNREEWCLLYETYLYEEFMLGALAGRAINCNKSDDSSIYRVKNPQEIEDRLQNSLGKSDAEEQARLHRLAFKLPDVVPFISMLVERYPAMKVVVMLREAIDTLNSLMKKKWFSHENNNNALIWPFREYQGVHVPFWVKEEDDSIWAELNELDRAAYYYVRVNENVDEIKGRIEVKYSKLLENPYEVAENLAALLGVSFGKMTEEIIAEIKPTSAIKDEKILESITPEYKEKVKYYSERSL